MGRGAWVELHTLSCPVLAVVLRHHAAGLDRAAAAALDVEPFLEDVGRPRERRVRVSHPLDDAGRAVFRHVSVDERPPRPRGRLEIGDHRQGLVLDVDQPDAVLGHVAVLGHDECNELARVADLVGRERPLGPGMAEPRMGNQERRRLVELTQVGGGEHQVHTRQRAGPRHVDRDDSRVRVGRAQAGGMEDPAGLDVVDERPQPPQEPRILVSRDAGTDQARRHRVGPAPSRMALRLRPRDLSTGAARVPRGPSESCMIRPGPGAMPNYVETFRATVAPADCDHLGHMKIP